GLAEFYSGRFEGSAAHLASVLNEQPGNREATLFLIRDYHALGRCDLALVTQALQRFGDGTEAAFLAGDVCLDRTRDLAAAAEQQAPSGEAFLWMNLRRAQAAADRDEVERLQRRIGGTNPPELIREYDELLPLVQ